MQRRKWSAAADSRVVQLRVGEDPEREAEQLRDGLPREEMCHEGLDRVALPEPAAQEGYRSTTATGRRTLHVAAATPQSVFPTVFLSILFHIITRFLLSRAQTTGLPHFFPGGRHASNFPTVILLPRRTVATQTRGDMKSWGSDATLSR